MPTHDSFSIWGHNYDRIGPKAVGDNGPRIVFKDREYAKVRAEPRA